MSDIVHYQATYQYDAWRRSVDWKVARALLLLLNSVWELFLELFIYYKNYKPKSVFFFISVSQYRAQYSPNILKNMLLAITTRRFRVLVAGDESGCHWLWNIGERSPGLWRNADEEATGALQVDIWTERESLSWGCSGGDRRQATPLPPPALYFEMSHLSMSRSCGSPARTFGPWRGGKLRRWVMTPCRKGKSSPRPQNKQTNKHTKKHQNYIW